LVRGGAGTRVFAETRRALSLLEAAGCPGGFQLYVLRDRDFIANGEFRRNWHGQLYNHSSRIHVR
jgi:hypothetical protein